MINSLKLAQNRQFNSLKREQYNKIYAHELAHKNAAGSLGGPIVIENDKNGMPIAGHVNIKMPSIDPNNPEKTAQDAKRVISAALAPSDPSAQDLKVAAEAKATLNKAENMVADDKAPGNKLNVIA